MPKTPADIRLLLALAVLLMPLSARGQEPTLQTETLAHGRYSTMHTLLEKSILRFDVVTVDLRFSESLQVRLAELVAGRERTRSLSDSVAALAVDARDVWAQVFFKRGIGLDQFVDAGRKNARRAHEAGLIRLETFSDVYYNLPVWYNFLQERRIQEGDVMFYRIRGDTLRTVYCGVDGEVFLDQIDVGPERRLSVMGSYFAPKSDFREGLVRSLFGDQEAGASTAGRTPTPCA